MGLPFNPCFFFLLFPLMVLLYFAHGEDEFLPSNCTNEFPCGSVGSLEFPFAPHTHPQCGLISVDCDAKQLPNIQLETGGDWYQLQLVKPSPVWGHYMIFLGDIKLQRLLEYPNYSNLNYTLQFPYSPSITFHNLEAEELNPTFLKCNYSEADDMGNYERYNCTQEFSFTLNYKHPLSPQNPKFEAPNYTLYPTPILVKQTNTVLTAQFGLEFQVSPACYDCYYNQGGQCTTDGKNKFHCKKEGSSLPLLLRARRKQRRRRRIPLPEIADASHVLHRSGSSSITACCRRLLGKGREEGGKHSPLPPVTLRSSAAAEKNRDERPQPVAATLAASIAATRLPGGKTGEIRVGSWSCPHCRERDPAAASHVVDVQKKRAWLGSSPEKNRNRRRSGAAGRGPPLPCRSSTLLVHGDRRSPTSLVACCVCRARGEREIKVSEEERRLQR
nr:LEAF RUST 10 DISEASE-RESISTANCE LOCUS RECEPTOR-LIKE PROTEIN KINASE-like 1.1 [Ipomoea batatas]